MNFFTPSQALGHRNSGDFQVPFGMMIDYLLFVHVPMDRAPKMAFCRMLYF